MKKGFEFPEKITNAEGRLAHEIAIATGQPVAWVGRQIGYPDGGALSQAAYGQGRIRLDAYERLVALHEQYCPPAEAQSFAPWDTDAIQKWYDETILPELDAKDAEIKRLTEELEKGQNALESFRARQEEYERQNSGAIQRVLNTIHSRRKGNSLTKPELPV